MTFDTLLYAVEEDGIALVTINRPDTLNALNATVIEELDQAFAAIATDDAVRGVILTGAGDRAFVAGADITQFNSLTPLTAQAFAQRGQAVFNRIEASAKPVIAAVNGFALGGGCELAMACHLRVAAETARFGQPEVNLGLIPGYGGTQRLPRLVGRGRATELILTGNPVKAPRAYEIGLVNQVVPADELLEAARALLRTILQKAPIAVGLALAAIQATDLPQPQGLAHEAVLFGQACASEDMREGVAAFLERRPAAFTGR